MNKLLAASFVLLASTGYALACDGRYECEMEVGNVARGLCTRLANNQVQPTDLKNGGGYVADPEAFATISKVCAVRFNIKVGDPDMRAWCNKINKDDDDRDVTINDFSHVTLAITSKYCEKQFNINIKR